MGDMDETLDSDAVDRALIEVWETFAAKSDETSAATRVYTDSMTDEDGGVVVPTWSTSSHEQLPAFRTQDRLAEEFKSLSRLGEGGMGRVYLAEQPSIGRHVALKALRPDRRDEYYSLKLLHEARITGRLEHPNIIPVHSIGADREGWPLYVMKRVAGVSWRDALREPERLPKVFQNVGDTLEAHLEIFERICNAISYAHAHGILHLDLKPSNVMLGEYGEVYVVDWGVAVSTQEADRGDLPMVDELEGPNGTP